MTKKALLIILGLLVIVLIVFWGDLLSVINPNRQAKILVSEVKAQLLTYPLIGPRSGQLAWYHSSAQNNLVKVKQISVKGWAIASQNLTSEDNFKLDNKIHELLIFQGFRLDPYNAYTDNTVSAAGYLKNNLACLKTNLLIETPNKQQFKLKLNCGVLINN